MTVQWKVAGAGKEGFVRFGDLLFFLDEEKQERIYRICQSPKSVWVGLFSYYSKQQEGNLSLYCRGEDYHHVVTRRLEECCIRLREAHPNHIFVPLVDNSPLPEQKIAIMAGIAQKGKHNLLIAPPYGSYFFLGTILTDLEMTNVQNCAGKDICKGCDICVKACPTGALNEGFDKTKCLSFLTQEKRELTQQETTWIQQTPYIWGCDICQKACPYNRTAVETLLPEFKTNVLTELTKEDLEGLSNRQFKEKYKQYAFSWRGIAPLRRNLSIREEEV